MIILDLKSKESGRVIASFQLPVIVISHLTLCESGAIFIDQLYLTLTVSDCHDSDLALPHLIASPVLGSMPSGGRHGRDLEDVDLTISHYLSDQFLFLTEVPVHRDI